ncbi:hypothetical protein D3Y59_11900 [Hymenobacter oligotrophus]|uniref:TonB-dependent receptor plug domain-containing protein n=1 Tax=Hymenobacter oligotrophus TaxID=2319843 RepID=A0A3B7QX17_9BACT|nr:TonB-dependent receptor plug domain-containing protein [Hymenobacter oligotrophus]AYA37688.1 hypothetical protein D3Y59_11900 [Hymenobacter oligotrophus]
MPRLLPACVLFLGAATAQAQQPDSLLSRSNSVVLLVTDSTAVIPAFVTVQPLLGRVAGVQVTPYSGAPGANAVVRVRGASGVANNPQPLYLLDGVPVFESTGFVPAYNLGPNMPNFTNWGLNPLLSLPASDIESVTVLKGALETARYGAQGQHGVISIRTRRGQAGGPRLRYTGYAGVQQARTRYDLLTARQYAELGNEALQNESRPPWYTPAEVAALGAGTDWQQELLRTAATHEHQLSLSGGLPTVRYYAAASYKGQQGILRNSHLQNFTGRANVEYQLSSKLTLETRLSGSHTTAAQSTEELPEFMLLALPTEKPYGADGELAKPMYYIDNPLRISLLHQVRPEQRQLLALLRLRYAWGKHATVAALVQGEQQRYNRSEDVRAALTTAP